LSIVRSKVDFLKARDNQSVDLDRRIEEITEALPNFFRNQLRSISKNNAATACDYITALNREINLSQNYRKDNIKILCTFSKFVDNKIFQDCQRNDIISFFDSLRKPESADPLHKWIGTYNLYVTYLLRFFKWLYNPDIEPDKRPKPEILTNLLRLRRREKSIYRPSDLWTPEDNLTFLKFCPSKRVKCYHAMAHDTACRPSELLKLRIKDIVFKYVGNAPVEDLLVARGLMSKDETTDSILRSKQCPNCNEPNKPDSKFCAKCRMVLTYDAYSETLEKQQEKESEMQKLREKQEQDMRLMREEMENKFQQILAKIDVATLK
jgi:hypothetical protein